MLHMFGSFSCSHFKYLCQNRNMSQFCPWFDWAHSHLQRPSFSKGVVSASHQSNLTKWQFISPQLPQHKVFKEKPSLEDVACATQKRFRWLLLIPQRPIGGVPIIKPFRPRCECVVNMFRVKCCVLLVSPWNLSKWPSWLLDFLKSWSIQSWNENQLDCSQQTFTWMNS